MLALWDRLAPDQNYDGAMGAKHAAIMQLLPIGDGLSFTHLNRLLAAPGSHRSGNYHMGRSQEHSVKGKACGTLRTSVYGRFILIAEKPLA